MCTYGIGLPFDHPIWQNLPPCNCGTEQQYRDAWAVELARLRRVVVPVIPEPVVVDDEPDPTELLAVR